MKQVFLATKIRLLLFIKERGMRLKMHTVHGVIFDGQVEKVELPSKV